MEDEAILIAINTLYQKLKGTQYESEALEAKQKIEEAIDVAETQRKADGAYEDYLNGE